MKPNILFISALSLFSVVSATISTKKPASHVGGVRGEQRYLGKKKKGDKEDIKKALLACKETEEFYYNALITIEDESKDSEATRECTDDDLIEIGMLIQDFVIEIDKDFPPYDGEMISTNVCIVPLQFPNKDRRRRLRRRRNRRYAWKSGGICRRCVDKPDRRLLRALGKDYKSLQEYAKLICEQIPVGELSLQVHTEGLDRGKQMGDDVDDILSDYKGKISDDLEEQLDELPKLIKKIQKEVDETKEGVEENKLACSIANELAAVEFVDIDDEEDAKKDAEKIVKDVIKFTERGEKADGEIEFLLALVKNVKGAVVEADMSYNFKQRETELKERLDKEKEILKEELDEMDEAMKELKDGLKESKSLMDAEKLIEEEAELQKIMLREKAKQEKLEMEFKYWTEDMKDEEKYVQTMMELTFEMEYAHTQQEWYQNYVDALETALPRKVMDAYSLQSGKGCLDERELRDFKIIVNLHEVPFRNDTYIDKCQFQYPDMSALGFPF